jgi:hypothetical protein
MAEDNPEKKKEKPMTFARTYSYLKLLLGLNQLAIALDSK